jgi:histone H4
MEREARQALNAEMERLAEINRIIRLRAMYDPVPAPIPLMPNNANMEEEREPDASQAAPVRRYGNGDRGKVNFRPSNNHSDEDEEREEEKPVKKRAPKRHRKIVRASRMNDQALRRLARRGGVKRISKAVLDAARDALKKFLTPIIYTATEIVKMKGRNTVTNTDMVYALKYHGRTLYGYSDQTVFTR